MQDKTEEIENIEWTVTGKVKKIERYAFSEKPDLAFDYDPMGRRIMKVVYPKSAPGVIDTDEITKTYYVHDAQGNVMSIYTLKTEDSEKNLYLSERMLYGSTRLGMEQVNQIVASTEPTNIDINTAQQRVVGDKRYELSNHLGNVLATVTDRKLPEFDATESLAYYKPDVVSYSDYYPGHALMPGRSSNTSEYRYGGVNGQEKVNELKGAGNHYTAEYWEYDPRIVRRWNQDPVIKHHESPYVAFANNPVWFSDPNGLDTFKITVSGVEGNADMNFYSIAKTAKSENLFVQYFKAGEDKPFYEGSDFMEGTYEHAYMHQKGTYWDDFNKKPVEMENHEAIAPQDSRGHYWRMAVQNEDGSYSNTGNLLRAAPFATFDVLFKPPADTRLDQRGVVNWEQTQGVLAFISNLYESEAHLRSSSTVPGPNSISFRQLGVLSIGYHSPHPTSLNTSLSRARMNNLADFLEGGTGKTVFRAVGGETEIRKATIVLSTHGILGRFSETIKEVPPSK